MDVKILLLLLEIVFVSCDSGEGNGDDRFKSRLDDFDMGPSMRVVDDSMLLPVAKRQVAKRQVVKRQGRGYTDFSDSEADAIVERHNYHRARTNPPASNMRHMTWDNDLAEMSQNYANLCIYEHGGLDGEDNLSSFPLVGKNLAVGTSPQSSSGTYVTNSWHREEDYYTYDTNGCEAGEMCGHYTQVVWADSYKVGCGRTLCPEIQVYDEIWTNAYYIVCNYGPAGNWRGQKPFKSGDRCAACPNDAAFCSENSLCRDCTQVSNKASCGECDRTCDNCGTLDTDSCVCQCAPGWEGATCSEVCADHHRYCGANPGWYGPELCYNSDNWEFGDSVRRYCLKMCGICQPEDPSFVCGGDGGGGGGGGDGGGGGPVCTDSHPRCAEWAGSGECRANPAWMLVNCKLSCVVCVPPTEPEKEPTVKNTKYCKTSFTATSVIDGDLFVFKKDKFWRFNDIRNGNLQSSAGGDLVRDLFPKVNPDIRAVYQRPDGKVAFIRGAKYWLYTKSGSGWTRDSGFPKGISQAFPGLLSPTAAVFDPVEGKTYFFSGTNFWRYDEDLQQFDVTKKPMTNKFKGAPGKLSGAFMDENSDFILLKGKDFWRVRRGEKEVSSVEPKNLALEYLDCYE